MAARIAADAISRAPNTLPLFARLHETTDGKSCSAVRWVTVPYLKLMIFPLNDYFVPGNELRYTLRVDEGDYDSVYAKVYEHEQWIIRNLGVGTYYIGIRPKGDRWTLVSNKDGVLTYQTIMAIVHIDNNLVVREIADVDGSTRTSHLYRIKDGDHATAVDKRTSIGASVTASDGTLGTPDGVPSSEGESSTSGRE